MYIVGMTHRSLRLLCSACISGSWMDRTSNETNDESITKRVHVHIEEEVQQKARSEQRKWHLLTYYYITPLL